MTHSKCSVSRVIRVTDGDTFVVDIDTFPKLFGYHIPVRVRGVNAPERRLPNGSINQKAFESTRFTADFLLQPAPIILSNIERDKYFRLLADVECNGRNLASELLRNGFAVQYNP